MMTDLVRFPDWRADLCALAPGVGVILRDYSHRDRAAIAAAMAQLCKAQSRVFLVAGDAQLAAQVKAGFHCPSHLLTRQPPQAMSGLRPATAAVHNRREIFQAAKSGYRAVLLSPAFPTTSHPDARAWGPVFGPRARSRQHRTSRLRFRRYQRGKLAAPVTRSRCGIWICGDISLSPPAGAGRRLSINRYLCPPIFGAYFRALFSSEPFTFGALHHNSEGLLFFTKATL
jgi:thiamine-phosphate pyrophosphorylase